MVEIVSALDGSLLEGIQVSYTGSESGSATTNSDGQVTISTFSSSAPITISASDSAYDDALAQTVRYNLRNVIYPLYDSIISVCCASWWNFDSDCFESISKRHEINSIFINVFKLDFIILPES